MTLLRQRIQLTLLRMVTGLIMFGEQLVNAAWRGTIWTIGFAGLWLLQFPQMFGTTGTVITLATFIVGMGIIVARYSPRPSIPTRRDIDRRLEQDNTLRHRPLSNATDTLANPQKDGTRTLWLFAQSRQGDVTRSLRPARPRAILTGSDPYALRFLVLIIALCGLVVAGTSWEARLRDGVLPFSWSFAATEQDTVTLWMTPPIYTGVAEMVFNENTIPETPITIPENSTLKLHMRARIAAPVLVVDGTAIEMEKLGDGNYGIVTPMLDATEFRIRQWGITRFSWTVIPTPDTPPTIEITGDPTIGARADAQIPVRIYDDYGVETITLNITPDPSIEFPEMGADYTAEQTIMSPPGMTYDTVLSFDLAWHPWAGSPVYVTLSAKDKVGNTVTIDNPLSMTLPERTFRNPAARALIALRKRLINTPEDAALNVSYDLQTILVTPDSYNQNLSLFLALRSAAVRLMSTPTDRTEIAEVISLLWDMATHLEDGNTGMAYRDVKQAQQELQNALRDPNTSPAELAQKVEELREAMAAYMREVVRQMQQNMAHSTAEQFMSPDVMEQMMQSIDLSAMLDEMMAQAVSGDRDAAQQMLNDMQRMMDSVDPSADTAMPQDMKNMMEMMAALQSVIEQQESLLATTKERADEPAPNTTAEQEAQDVIRAGMNDIMMKADEGLGRIPDAMGNAEQFMRGSGDELGRNDPAASIPFQQDALDALRQQQRQMAEMIQNRLKQMTLMSFGGGMMRMDPLGRPMAGDDSDGGTNPFSRSRVKIPDETERRRVYNLMQELRKKSGELTRPDYELEYFQRLMRQF